jgi:hypothetical protein
MRLYPISALRVLRLAWPVHELWAGAEAASVVSHPAMLRVWRAPNHSGRHATIEWQEASALLHLMNGEPFGAVCETFSDLTRIRSRSRGGPLFARWISDSLVAVKSNGPDLRLTRRRCAGCAA